MTAEFACARTKHYIAVMKYSKCQSQRQPGEVACSNCGFEFPIDAEIVDAELGNPFAPPVKETGPRAANRMQQTGGDSTGGLIPYKNPKALIAYYLGIVSGLPFIGFPFAIAAVILGIKGLSLIHISEPTRPY